MRRLATFYLDAFRGLPRAVWLACIVTLVNRAGTMVLPFLSLYLVEKLEFSATAAGWFLAAFGLGSVVGSHVGGILSERIGSRTVLILSLFGAGLAFLVLPLVQSAASIAALLFVIAAIGDSFRPAVMSYVADGTEPEGKTRALALLRLAVNVGMALGPAVGGLLAAIDYTWLFRVDGATCILAAAVGAFILPRTSGDPSAPVSFDQPTASPWRDGPFVLFLGLVLVTSCLFFQLLATVPVWLRQEAGLPEVRIGLFFAINALTVSLLEMPTVHFAERFRPLAVCGVGAALVGLGLGLMPLTGGHFGWIIATLMVWTLGEMLSAPFSNAVVAHRAPAGRSGRYMGAYGMMWALALLIGPVVGMATYETIGPDAFWTVVAILGAGLLLAYRLLASFWQRSPRPSAA